MIETQRVDSSVEQANWADLDADGWGMAGYDPNSSGPTTGPDARWIHEFTDDDVDIPAVIAGELVVVPGADSIRALDNETGEIVWNATVDDSFDTISAANGVVVTTEGGYGGEIRAYDAADGAEIWNETDFSVDASTVLEETLYVSRGEYLHAFDLQDGTKRWSYALYEDISNGLSAAGETVYAIGEVNNRDHAVYALNASDGSERWRFEMEGEISMLPTVSDGFAYVGAGDETSDPKFYKLDVTDGHVEWIFDVNTQPRGAAVADGSVYLAAGNTIHALDEATGQRAWRHRLAGSIEYGVHYHDMDTLTPVVADGTVYAANDRGFLVALEGATGTELWDYRLEGEGTAPVVADDRLYAHVTDTEGSNTDYSRVYALEDAPFSYTDFAVSKSALEPGEEFAATVTVENVDDETRHYNLSLVAEPPLPADWRPIDQVNGTLAPGESAELAYTGRLNVTGSWNVSLRRPLARDPAVDPVTVAVATPADSDDWPSTGFDSGRTKWNPDTVGPMRNAQEVWNLTYFDEYLQPVIANGSVFVVQDYGPSGADTLAAYDEATGALEWEFDVSVNDRIPAGSPTVDGDTVYLFTQPMNFDGNGPNVVDNSLFALDTATGSVEWRRDFTLNESLGSFDQAPVISDGQVYVAGGTPDGNYDANASVTAFDAASGEQNWRYRVSEYRENELFYSIAAADGRVVATLADEDGGSGGSTDDDRLVVLNAAGGHEWSTSGLQIDVMEPPVIQNGTVYAISETHQQDGDPLEVLHAFDLADGSEHWSFSLTHREDEASGWTLDSPIVTDDAVYVHQRIDLTYDVSQLYRLDATTGDVVWNRSVPNLRTTFAVGGLLFAGETGGDYTHVYDAETGEKYTETDFHSRGKGTAMVVANGTMITYADTTSPNKFRVVREGGLIEYTDLSVDSHTIGEEENVTVTATATNHGAYARNYDVNLDLAPDNNADRHFWNTASRHGTLAPGESTTITWTVRLDVREDFVFFLVPINDGDGTEDDVVAMNLHKYDRAGTQTVHVGDDRDGSVVAMGGPRDLDPGAGSWPKESFDAGNTGNYTGIGAPTAVGDDTVTWIANHSSEWTSGPTVAEETIFVGGNDGGDDKLYAFNATDGSSRWEYPTDSDVEIAPTYAGGYLYTADGSRVYQFDAATGERLWTFDAGGSVGGITVVDDVAYVTAEYYRYVGGETTTEDRLYALNATTREIRWTFVRSSVGGFSDNPAVENGTVYVTHDSQATYALDAATGAVEWDRPIAGSGSSLHSPVVEDGVVYIDDTTYSSTDANLYALNAADGSTIWSAPANVDGYTGSSPALANGTLFFTADGVLRAVDATTGPTGGDLRWSNQICAAARNSPVHAGGIVFVPMDDSTIRAYDADSGDLVWRYDAHDEYSFTPAVVDGILYSTGLENVEDVHALVALAGGATAEPKSVIAYSSLALSGEVAAVGEPITASATVENIGETECDYTADLLIDDVVADTQSGTLQPGYDTDVQFTHTFSATGTYDVTIGDLPAGTVTVEDGTQPAPAHFEVEIDETNSPVESGHSLDIAVTVENTGDESGTQTVTLDLGGTAVDSVSLSLDSAGMTTTTLSYVPGDSDVGHHTATVSSTNDTDSATVEVTSGGNGMDGDGTETNPYVITDVDELQLMADDPSAHYVLGTDIDASATATWNDDGDGPNGFEPVGYWDDQFTGSLDGAGYEISDLYIDRGDEFEVGLFGSTHDDARVEDVTLTDVDVTGKADVGGLAGYSEGTLTDVSVTGTVTAGEHNLQSYAGGLLGQNHGTIVGATADATVSGAGHRLGGVVGENRGAVTDVTVTASISAPGYDNVGGLAGYNRAGTITEAVASGTVAGENDVGGLVGGMDGGTIGDSTADVSVTGNGSRIGGLVGNNYEGGFVEGSTASGTVSGTGHNIGGLVGTNLGDVSNVSASGDVVGGGDRVGGLVGNNDGNVTDAFATGDVTGADHTGGLIGYATYSTVTVATATGAVDGNERVGGLVGFVYQDTTIDNASATGDVSGDLAVGGLVGYASSAGVVTNAHANGAVTGTDTVGGLVGNNRATITNTYASGFVDGTTAGGLVGDATGGSVVDSYWDLDATNQSSSAGSPDSAGRLTTELTGAVAGNGTVPGFDFDGNWTVTDDYPRLRAHASDVAVELGDTELEADETTNATVALVLFDGSTVPVTDISDYLSTEPSVATVSASGLVTAIDDGESTIEARASSLVGGVTLEVDSSSGGGGGGGLPSLPPRDDDDDDRESEEPSFVVSDGTLSATDVSVGEPVTVTATITNDGDAAGTFTGTLTADGSPVESVSVDLDPGQSDSVSITWTPSTTGDYTLTLDGEAVGTLTVSDDDTTDAPDDGVDDDDDSSADDGSPPPNESDSTPGFSIVGTLFAIALCVIVVARRHRPEE